ncbi:hypothetical protein LSAT2_014560, partial [Lamellibrachia satsuma]
VYGLCRFDCNGLILRRAVVGRTPDKWTLVDQTVDAESWCHKTVRDATIRRGLNERADVRTDACSWSVVDSLLPNALYTLAHRTTTQARLPCLLDSGSPAPRGVPDLSPAGAVVGPHRVTWEGGGEAEGRHSGAAGALAVPGMTTSWQ